jgi:hypothetical protein
MYKILNKQPKKPMIIFKIMELICITYTNHSPNHLCNELGGSLAMHTHIFHTSISNVQEFPYPRHAGYIIPLNMAIKKTTSQDVWPCFWTLQEHTPCSQVFFTYVMVSMWPFQSLLNTLKRHNGQAFWVYWSNWASAQKLN